MYRTFATKYRAKKRNIIEKYRVGKGFGATFTTAADQQRTRHDGGSTGKPPSTTPDMDGVPSKDLLDGESPWQTVESTDTQMV